MGTRDLLQKVKSNPSRKIDRSSDTQDPLDFGPPPGGIKKGPDNSSVQDRAGADKRDDQLTEEKQSYSDAPNHLSNSPIAEFEASDAVSDETQTIRVESGEPATRSKTEEPAPVNQENTAKIHELSPVEPIVLAKSGDSKAETPASEMPKATQAKRPLGAVSVDTKGSDNSRRKLSYSLEAKYRALKSLAANGLISLSRKELAKAMIMSETSARRLIDDLEGHGLLKKVQEFDPTLKKANVYRILDID